MHNEIWKHVNFFPRVGVGLNEDKQKIKKITIPVQIILCFSAKNINWFKSFHYFNILVYYFMKKKYLSFLSIWYAVHILRGLYFCTYSALTSRTFHSLHPTKGVIQPFTFQLCVTTKNLKGILIWFTHEPMIHTHCCLYSKIAFQRANNHKKKDKKRLVQLFWLIFFFFTKGEEYGWLGALNCFHLVVKYLAPTDKSEMAKK